MLIIPVKDGESIDRALKRYKRKYDRTRVVRRLRDKQQFTKPSVTRRQEKQRAAYRQRMQSKAEA
ncbi:MAG: 30S ribosomal protein S21 [Weeksellaceae bacterium]|nr:30S ribosomal protein S21 [Weeksellaceae bacterium]